jgi:hypothetical protein
MLQRMTLQFDPVRMALPCALDMSQPSIAFRIDAVDLKKRLCNVETECIDRLH